MKLILELKKIFYTNNSTDNVFSTFFKCIILLYQIIIKKNFTTKTINYQTQMLQRKLKNYLIF